MLLEESASGPAEYQRALRGLLKQTVDAKRTITIASGPSLLLRHHVCDWCNRKLQEDDVVWCVTWWMAGREIAPWEHLYLKEAP